MNEPRQYDSRLWTGEIEAAVPAAKMEPPPALTWKSDLGVRRKIAFLTFSPLLAWPARVIIGAVSGDLLISGPPAMAAGIVIVCVGLALMFLAAKFKLPRWVGTLSWLGGCAVAWLAIVYVALAIFAHAHTDDGPEEPARIVGLGRKHSDHSVVIEFADGSWTSAWGYGDQRYGSLGRCLTIQRRDGPFSFSWIRIVSAAPLPGSGQLAWPTDPASCFSHQHAVP